MGDPRSILGRWRAIVWLAVPCLTYLAITGYWQQRGLQPIVGDEPVYLIIAQALMVEHTFDLEHSFTPPLATYVPIEAHAQRRHGGLYSHHGLGLPVLIAVPHHLFGVGGAKIALACLAGLLVTVFFRVVYAVTGRRGWSLATFLVVAASLPYTMAADQIYPDLLAGLLIAWLLYLVARGWEPAGQWPSLLAFALAGGFLPWLHHRHALVAGLLALAFAARMTAVAAPADGTNRWLNGLRQPRLLVPLAIMFVLGFGEVVYAIWLFGSFTGYGTPRLMLEYGSRMLLGLHLDQFQGLFFQNPLFLLGLPGLAIFVRDRPRLAALWITVYGLAVLPVCTSTVGYGGGAFAGRFQWPLAPLWIFPLAHFIAWVLRRRHAALALTGVLTAAACVQLAYARLWLPGIVPLISLSPKPLWAISTFYPTLRWHLPWFSEAASESLHWPNVAWVTLAILAVVVGVGLARDETRYAFWLCLVPGLVLLLVPHTRAMTPLQHTGSTFPNTTGRDVVSHRVAIEGADAPGPMLFGLGQNLPPGCYEIELAYRAAYLADADASRWDWATPTRSTPLAQGELPRGPNGTRLRRQMRIAPGGDLMGFEFRIWFSGKGTVDVESVAITPRARCDAGAVAVTGGRSPLPH